MKLEELRKAIEDYPELLAKSMADVAKAEQAIERLEEKIAEEESSLSPQDEQLPQPEEDRYALEQKLLILEKEIALAEIEIERTRGAVEIAFRKHPPEGEKVTEATVAAHVKSDLSIIAAKERCLEKKLERDQLHLEQCRQNFERRQDIRRPSSTTSNITNPKLNTLREKLSTAEFNLSIAENRLEEVKARINSYQLLVSLYTTGLIKN